MGEKGLMQTVRDYPRAVFYSLGNELCERFSYFGMRAILVLYLLYEHHMPASKAFLVYHIFIALSYLSSLIGSIAADNYFGRFKVIVWGSVIYVMGHVCLSFGAIPNLEHSVRSLFDFGGLFIIALATGTIKPCVSAFAADQFEGRSEADKERERFFSFWYFAINAGSLMGMIITPILRGRVSCLGSDYCYPLAFGVPGLFMLFAFLIFLSGIKHYRKEPADKDNVIGKVVQCIAYAAKQKITAKIKGHDTPHAHWLDYAHGRFSHALVAGVKSMLGVGMLYIPVVGYSALNDQMGSTWQEQSIKLNGRVGPFTILPDQLKILNPLLILFMVPVFEAYIYPCWRKFTPVTPLRKMATGGILTALAFVMAGFLELSLAPSIEPPPQPEHGFVQLFGNASGLDLASGVGLRAGKNELRAGQLQVRDGRGPLLNLTLGAHDALVLAVYETAAGARPVHFAYQAAKPENLRTRLYLLVPPDSALLGQPLLVYCEDGQLDQETSIGLGRKVDLQPGSISSPRYRLKYGEGCTRDAARCPYERDLVAEMGAVLVLDLAEVGAAGLHAVVRPNTVNILWQIPQYVVISAGEILFGISGLEFSYQEAAPNMKSVLQAMWLMTTFFGNLLDAAISGSRAVADPAAEFFLYAGLMFAVMAVFIGMAARYRYVDRRDFDETASAAEDSDAGLRQKPKISAD